MTLGGLADFAYRINISWWVFVIAGIAAIAIAFIAISVQAIKISLANLIESLRTESYLLQDDQDIPLNRVEENFTPVSVRFIIQGVRWRTVPKA